MTTALACVGLIIATYATPPGLWFGIPYYRRRRHEREAAFQAEMLAIEAWIQQIRSA